MIQEIRESLQRHFSSKLDIPCDHQEVFSPCGRYQLIVDDFSTQDIDLVVAVIRLQETNETIATIMRNDSRVFFAWITRDNHDYLDLPKKSGREEKRSMLTL
ncbi:MAG: hypothetical protein WCJ09_21670, partial [Planctomycetota bacterium]